MRTLFYGAYMPSSERIVQVGKKKLVLDHLIVQKMDDEDSGGENVQSILTFGAQALFDADSNSRDITCESASLANHHRLKPVQPRFG
jgi:hypothetical protein